jgi:hypothetical protein
MAFDKKAWDKNYYLTHKGVAAASNRQRRIRNSQLFFEYMKNRKCEWPAGCEISDPDMLTLDHLDPKTKRMDVSRMVRGSYGWKTILSEIEKCRVLCANHHHKFTIQQFGYKKWLADSGSQNP